MLAHQATPLFSSTTDKGPVRGPASTPQRAVQKKAVADDRKSLLDAEPHDWTDNAIYEFFCGPTKKLPELIKVLGMHVRRVGGNKFLCTFLNNERQECTVWVGDGQLARLYPDIFQAARVEFAAAAAR